MVSLWYHFDTTNRLEAKWLETIGDLKTLLPFHLRNILNKPIPLFLFACLKTLASAPGGMLKNAVFLSMV
jgi:hypothetical protein